MKDDPARAGRRHRRPASVADLHFVV